MPPRSWLFIPGDSEKKLGKALTTGAHAVIIDLEDAVALSAKPQARALSREWLCARRVENADNGQPALWVRINAFDTGLWQDDLATVMSGAPAGIMLPKSEGPDQVAELSQALDLLEQEHGIAPGATRILPLVSETARSALTIPAYAAATLPRLAGLTWGAEDLSAALSATRKRDAGGLWTDTFRMVRAQCLLTAHACNVWPVDTLHDDFRDEDGMRRAAENARADGFAGMLAIHPAQVPIINSAFAPTEAELAEAQAIVALFAGTPDAGTLQYQGRMVDQPHLRMARQLLGLG
ncbi:CoA ester lyase [Novosphingobium sp. SL115]|uniref:HpcH/HpaI aldolase/citrate lyase family protein n=1 Tax=Novosphingobium sp. SL115 TaxID=2995150 RepID=UPI0022743704|nr:CoA ester lyase [Novosphingobium sp. SL115]MCY1670360.1 CoA ester lyase [Novosphingobium sp. SL115]